MIDIENAEKAFRKYVKDFESQDDKVQIKIRHTFGVEKIAGYIAKKLNLSNEDINLAKIIGLLHDIGRFEQAIKYDNFDDYDTIDHAELGVQILFDNGLIENFLKDRQYDEIVKKAILNHNKYEIDFNLSEREKLFAKIIRDADKTDNFEVKQYQNLDSLLKCSKEEAENQEITDVVWNEFLSEKTIISSNRVTAMDRWISFIAWIYDYNFDESLEYVKENDCIQKIIDRLDYKNIDTKEKMEYVRQKVNGYISRRLAKS